MGWGRRGAGRPGLGGGPACGAPGARQGEPTGPPPRARGPGRCPRRRPRPARRAGSARWQKGLLGNVVPRARQSGASVRRLRGRQRAGKVSLPEGAEVARGLPASPPNLSSCPGLWGAAPRTFRLRNSLTREAATSSTKRPSMLRPLPTRPRPRSPAPLGPLASMAALP